MSAQLMALVTISLAGLLGVSIYRFLVTKNVRSFALHLLLICLVSFALYAFFFRQVVPLPKGGSQHEISLVIGLYGFMLLGMLAHYCHSRFMLPKKSRGAFDFGLFIAPVFASPIVFIPLFAVFQSAGIEFRNISEPKTLMFFLVAFENGFFWKEYFDNRKKEKKNGDS